MEDWGTKQPEENGKEDFRSLVDNLFADKKEEPKEEKKAPRYTVNIPEAPAQTKEQEAAALVHAKEEMEKIRKAFLDFTDQVNETVTYSYLYSEVEDFVEACKDMLILLTDEIDKDELTEHGLKDYEKLRKIRARILSDITDKYKKKGE